MDSPRGRIQLMEKTAQGTLTLSPTVDRALRPLPRLHGLRDELPVRRAVRPADRGDAARRSRTEHRRPRAERLQRRLLFATLPYPRRMRWALRLAPLGRRLPAPAWARPMLDLAPRWRSAEQPAPVTPCAESTQAPRRVGLLTGCVQSVVFGEVNAATARVLAAAGHEVVAPPQGCCGALSAHAGRADESARFTERLRRSFDGLDTIVVNASGCGSHLKDDGLPALDVTEALARRGAAGAPPARAHGRLPGLLPPPARAAAAGRVDAAARADPGPPRRRARRAGHLLRLGGDLQRHAARGRPRPRRPQGRPRPGDRAGRLRERQSRAASSRSRRRSAGPAARFPPSTRSSCSTRRSAASSARGPARAGPPLSAQAAAALLQASDPLAWSRSTLTLDVGRASRRDGRSARPGDRAPRRRDRAPARSRTSAARSRPSARR